MNNILVELQETMGDDRSIANAAWTSSYDKSTRDSRTDEQVASIVHRLAKDGHSVPFESVILRFWIRMPIFIDRQHMTHRIASHSGLSGRYRTMPTDYYELPDDVIDILEKVSSLPNIFPTPENPTTKWHIFDAFYESVETATNNYKLSIETLKHYEKQGVITNQEYKRTREILRGQLPLACFTERTTIMNLRSFANYQKLRNSEHAQPEIQHIAQRMMEEIEKANICPAAIQALKANDWRI